MGENQNSVVVLRIQLKFWWMIPKGVKYNRIPLPQMNPLSKENRHTF